MEGGRGLQNVNQTLKEMGLHPKAHCGACVCACDSHICMAERSLAPMERLHGHGAGVELRDLEGTGGDAEVREREGEASGRLLFKSVCGKVW